MDLKKRPSEAKNISKRISKQLEKGSAQEGVDLVGLTMELAKRKRASEKED